MSEGKDKEKKGFDYYLLHETIEEYRKIAPELRLKWLYMGNLLRKGYSKDIIKIQDNFRVGK